MIRLSWTLPASLTYSPMGVIDITLTVKNLSDKAQSCCLVCGLFDLERGVLVIDPSSGRIAYYGVVISDSEFLLDPDNVSVIELEGGESKSFSGSVQFALTNVLFGISVLSEDQTELLDALYTELRAITSTSLIETMMPMIAIVVVGVITGVIVGQIGGN